MFSASHCQEKDDKVTETPQGNLIIEFLLRKARSSRWGISSWSLPDPQKIGSSTQEGVMTPVSKGHGDSGFSCCLLVLFRLQISYWVKKSTLCSHGHWRSRQMTSHIQRMYVLFLGRPTQIWWMDYPNCYVLSSLVQLFFVLRS